MSKRLTSKSAGLSKLPPSLQEAFLHFIENHPPKRFSKNLSRMILAHMIYESESSSPYMQETLLDLEGLFVLLEAIEEET
ncbi:hypothetical protein [Ohtaekwangia sp.]|uniref:hypothetical protein n=1 Tax=Ohtaekwangia sp. TaxID=2066019 RepID=UPI002FDE9BEB